MSARTQDVVMPPDSYADVYDGALCEGLYGVFPVELCDGCPVKQRCNALHDDLQFGSLAYGGEDGVKYGRLDGILTGVWGGHWYEQTPNKRYMRDGLAWPVLERPRTPSWV